MARIRTIKPEFPQSESMGNVSRDARLTFLQLWTIADDEGRLRGNSRMLASLLFPYDDDAPGLIDGWLAELEKEGCIIRYKHAGQNYMQIANWLIHQKIDKPSKSKIPEFVEGSQILSKAREVSSEDQGSRIKDQGRDQVENTTPPAVAAAPKFDFAKALADRGVPEHLIAAWLHVRKTKRAVNTEIAFDGFMREVQKSGRPLSEVVETCIKRSWSGFEVDWLGSKGQISNQAPAVSSLGKHGDATAENARAWLQQPGRRQRSGLPDRPD